MLTRNTAGGYAMTRAAAEAKWNEWVQRHDANSDGKLSYKEIAAGITHQPRKPAYMEAVKKTVKDFPFLELAGGAFAIASKVSKEVYEVDTLYGILMRGEAKIGAGEHGGAAEGQVHAGRPAQGRLPDRDGQPPRAPRRGARRLALRVRHVRRRDDHRRHHLRRRRRGLRDVGEVEAVPRRGRRRARRPPLRADRRVHRERGARSRSTASATVANGKGSIVWANGDYYVGEIKGGQMNGEGTYNDASGTKYVGQWKDGKCNGEGPSTNGDKYIGQFKTTR